MAGWYTRAEGRWFGAIAHAPKRATARRRGARRGASPSTNSVGVVATPARMPDAEVGADPLGDRVGAPVGVEAREVEPQPLRALPTGAGPRGAPGRRTARRGRARTRPAARPPRPRRRRPARAGGWSARGSAGTRPQLQAAQARLDGGAERALVVAVDDHQPRALRSADVRGPVPAVRSRATGQTAAASSASKIRLAPGRSPGESRLVAPQHDAVGHRSSRAPAAGSRPGAARRTRGRRRPWARSPTAARS